MACSERGFVADEPAGFQDTSIAVLDRLGRLSGTASTSTVHLGEWFVKGVEDQLGAQRSNALHRA